MWRVGNATIEYNTGIALDPTAINDYSVRDKISLAIKNAPLMVDAAIAGLAELDRSGGIRMVTYLNPAEGLVYETIASLTKYFRIHKSNDPYTDVQKITMIYRCIKTGLSAPYKIWLYGAPAKQHGYMPATPDMETALNRFMDPSADVDGHLIHRPNRVGEIHLNYIWLKKPDVPADQIARCIVHEASHKWGYTNDKVYKSERVFNDDAQSREEAVAFRELESLAVVGGKSIVPIDKAGDTVSNRDLITNADSYAWAARRIWKRRVGAMQL